jgi:hypothetical protein
MRKDDTPLFASMMLDFLDRFFCTPPLSCSAAPVSKGPGVNLGLSAATTS